LEEWVVVGPVVRVVQVQVQLVRAQEQLQGLVV
jgi:hypothetical protein